MPQLKHGEKSMAAAGEFALEALLGFIAGASFAAFRIPLWETLAAVILAVVWLRHIRRLTMLAVWLAGGAFLFGFGYYFLYTQSTHAFLKFPPQGENFKGIVIAEPKLTGRLSRFSISLQSPYRGTIEVFASLDDVQYGDLLSLQGYIENRGGTLILNYPKAETLARHQGNWMQEKLYAVKRAVIRGFERVLPPDNAALLAGITLGARSTFSKDLKDDMATSGTLHIVAVSGYNISVLAIAIGNAAAFFISRRIAILAAVIAILLFVGMVGTEASVIRAALMGIVGLVGESAGRPNNQAYAIALAASLMIAWDPTIIREDLGFSLSFLSLLGVTYLGPALRSLWRKANDKGVLAWKENVDATLGAQCGVLPVLLTAFGNVSLTSIFANVLIIPFIPLTMGMGFALGIVNWAAPLLSFPVAEIIRMLTSYEIAVIRFFADAIIPVHNFFFTPFMIIVYYSAISLFVLWRANKEKSSSVLP